MSERQLAVKAGMIDFDGRWISVDCITEIRDYKYNTCIVFMKDINQASADSVDIAVDASVVLEAMEIAFKQRLERFGS